ncbi:MAG: M23 family metallopeptidase, partial [Thermoleophilia bacterium]|nr:M23 family metallopeptidase [Thermoleophilia bacterium]
GEGGTVKIVGTGGHRVVTTTLVGAHNLSLSGASLGLVARSRAVTSTVTITVTDDAGNSTSKLVRVMVPARAGASPTAPAPVTPTPPATGVSGKVPTLVWPSAGCQSSYFGPRGTGFHYGIDLASPVGTVVNAAAGGIIGYAGTMSGYGNIVIVQHPGGSSTRYAHLSRIDVVVGQTVTQSMQIALSGNTGHSTGPHLHFEVRIDDVAQDPMAYLPATGRPAGC